MSIYHVKALGLGLMVLGYFALIEIASYVLARRYNRITIGR